MAEEQGLSGANRALIERADMLPLLAGKHSGISIRELNRLLDAARSEGPLPVGGEGGSTEDLCGSGAQERPSRRAPTDCQTSGGAK